MTDNNDRLGENTDNTHRSLQQLVSVNAWFAQDKDAPARFTLHANVTFNEERLGGDAATQVVFKLAVKRCDIIFVLPKSAPFRVDPSSVRSPKPLNPKSVIYKDSSKTGASARGKLGLSLLGPKASGEVDGSHEIQQERVTSSEQFVSHYNELWKMIRGNHAWSVDGRELDNKRLAGPVFDAHNDPRLTIVDGRTDEAREKDNANNLNPVAGVQVRCLREDIDIYDIEFKDNEKQKRFEFSSHKQAKLATAVEVLKEAILKEGLVVGNIASDPYAEMTICDVAISITDNRT